MPLLFALGQHRALHSVQSHLLEDERLLAFHDDIYVVSQPERTCELYGILARELWAHSRIRINGGKTQIWNRGGFIPGHDALLAIARQDDPDAQIWFGDHAAPESERGIRVLGTPSHAFVRAQLQAIGESHELLLSRIPAIQDLQSAWLLLLFCAATCATFYLRVCHPEHSVQFAHQHNVYVWQCFCSLLGQPLHSTVWEVSSLPFHLGGLGLRSASRTIHAACWDSWADCLNTPTLPRPWYKPSIRPRRQLSTWLVQHGAVLCWLQKGLRARLGISSSKDCALNSLRLTRWNQVFSLTDGSFSLERLLNSASVQQSCGRGALPLSKHSSVLNRVPCPGFLFPPSLPLLLSASPLNFSGCFSFADSGFLFHLLRAPAGVAVSSTSLAITVQRVRGQVFSEVVVSPWKAQLLGFAVRPAPASPRTSSSVIWTSLWLGRTGAASRLLLVVYLCSVVPNWRSTPRSCRPSEQMGCLAISAQTWMARHLLTPVVARSVILNFDGHGQARLVVLAAEVGGRWWEEARAFVSHLAKGKARSVPRVLAGRARQAWQHRWAHSSGNARVPARSLCLCWTADPLMAPTVPSTSVVITECRHVLPSEFWGPVVGSWFVQSTWFESFRA